MISSLSNLAAQFAALPGIGSKSAMRLAYHVLSMPKDKALELANAIVSAKDAVHLCPNCFNMTDTELCEVCASAKRDNSTICVVEHPGDVTAIERTHEYRGLYHVLHGCISPMNNVSPDDLYMKELLSRITDDIAEVIVATNPTVEGEATAIYIARLLAPMGVKVTRIAHGLPVGADLEYADEMTLTRALDGRREI